MWVHLISVYVVSLIVLKVGQGIVCVSVCALLLGNFLCVLVLDPPFFSSLCELGQFAQVANAVGGMPQPNSCTACSEPVCAHFSQPPSVMANPRFPAILVFVLVLLPMLTMNHSLLPEDCLSNEWASNRLTQLPLWSSRSSQMLYRPHQCLYFQIFRRS